MLYVILITLVASCSIKTTTPGRALVSNMTVEELFSVVVQVLSESDFLVVSMNKDMGFISATRAGGIMATKDITINCNIQKTADDNISVDVTSTLGMAVAYGMTKDAIKVLFQRLAVHLPDAKLTIDGKPFNPNRNEL